MKELNDFMSTAKNIRDFSHGMNWHTCQLKYIQIQKRGEDNGKSISLPYLSEQKTERTDC